MRDGDDLNFVISYAIHDEERKATQEYAPGISEIGRTSIGSLGNQVDRPIDSR